MIQIHQRVGHAAGVIRGQAHPVGGRGADEGEVEPARLAAAAWRIGDDHHLIRQLLQEGRGGRGVARLFEAIRPVVRAGFKVVKHNPGNGGRRPTERAGRGHRRPGRAADQAERQRIGRQVRIGSRQIEAQRLTIKDGLVGHGQHGRGIDFVHRDAEGAGTAHGGSSVVGGAHRDAVGAGALRLGRRPGKHPGRRVNRRAGGRSGIQAPGEGVSIGVGRRGGERHQGQLIDGLIGDGSHDRRVIYIIHGDGEGAGGALGRLPIIGHPHGNRINTGPLRFGRSPREHTGDRVDAGSSRRPRVEAERQGIGRRDDEVIQVNLIGSQAARRD